MGTKKGDVTVGAEQEAAEKKAAEEKAAADKAAADKAAAEEAAKPPDVKMGDAAAEKIRKDVLGRLETLEGTLLGALPSFDSQRADLRNVLGFMAERPNEKVDALLAAYRKDGPAPQTSKKGWVALGGFFGESMTRLAELWKQLP